MFFFFCAKVAGSQSGTEPAALAGGLRRFGSGLLAPNEAHLVI